MGKVVVTLAELESEPPEDNRESADELRRRLGRRRQENIKGSRKRLPGSGRYEVWASPAENALLREMAAARRVSVPRLLVESTLIAGPRATSGLDIGMLRETATVLYSAVRLLGSISNNINQMAAKFHASGRIPDALDSTLDGTRRATDRLLSIAEELRQR